MFRLNARQITSLKIALHLAVFLPLIWLVLSIRSGLV